MAYGEVKLESLGGLGGEYEDPHKLARSASGPGGGNYEPTGFLAHYEIPFSKPTTP